MFISGHEFSEAVLDRIREAVRCDAGLSRSALARQVCHWVGWLNALGKPCATSCALALQKLQRDGLIELPAARAVSFEARRPLPPPAYEWPTIRAPLSALGPIDLLIVNGNAQRSRQWRAMMREHHDLGDGPLCGAQIRYLVRSARGIVGGLSFSAAARRLGARDEWIGWSDGRRRARLRRVVNNSRFLILPGVEVKNLASHVLGLATRRLAADWQRHYGERPVLVETFVDQDHYRGTSYRAANWIRLGLTQGRGRQDSVRAAQVSRKHIFVYPLRRDARRILCAPVDWPGLLPRDPHWVAADGDAEAHWTQVEFGRARLAPPLGQRLHQIARAFMADPQAQIPQACGGDHGRVGGRSSQAMATYRFMDHPDVTFEGLLQPHYAATEERIAQLPAGAVVLVAQDTTSLNFSHVSQAQGLGPIGTSADGAQGLLLHSSYAVDPQGLPLGFLQATCWNRPKALHGVRAKASAPIEEKESHRWLQHYRAVSAVQQRQERVTLVSVGDREADLFELFAAAAAQQRGAKLLVRAAHDRQVQAGDGHDEDIGRLFAVLQAAPRAGELIMAVPPKPGQENRITKLAVRHAALKVQPPARLHSGAAPVACWGVLVQEDEPPADVEPLQWLLLTTVPVNTFEDACERANWYRLRWGIEVFHRTLKTGCKVEQRQLETADRLQRCLAIDMVVAWRICRLVHLGRVSPDLPCTVYFEAEQWKALLLLRSHRLGEPLPNPLQPPSLREAIREVAGIGGFLGRKSDGEPGAETMWRGLTALDVAAFTLQAALAALPQDLQKLKSEPRRRRPNLRKAE
jgi:hypothetical protein